MLIVKWLTRHACVNDKMRYEQPSIRHFVPLVLLGNCSLSWQELCDAVDWIEKPTFNGAKLRSSSEISMPLSLLANSKKIDVEVN